MSSAETAPRGLPSAARGPRSVAARGTLRRVLVAGLAALLGACSAVGLGPGGDRQLVRLYDAKHQLRLELSNETNPELADVYSKEKEPAQAALKLAPDRVMELLLADLDKLRFEELSVPGAPPPSGVRGWVEVTRDGKSRTFVVPETGATADQLTSFAYMRLAMNKYYTDVGGLQYIENPQGAALLKHKAGGK